ncbi:Mitotic spindle checkpoint protein MAD2 [Zea mays]|uniref:Mitotic spindle checkpoint protein MAD2 n=1 Tax=Zea mays TaxID=4577 RepID=A0A1D6J8X0_MAIZE|nr:Mitotic spindle checkpoint protein MAD2 [Zea mays]
MASRSASKDIITLRGSAAIVSEFFGYAANRYGTLYSARQTAAVPVHPGLDRKVKKYGLTMLLTQDEGVKNFIASLTSQLSEWLEAGKLQRIVLVIMSKATSEVLERWNFNIVTDAEVVEKGAIKEKSDKEIMREIQAIMRQIASCITYLPCLDEPCVFDVLAYTDTDVDAPGTWVESDAKLIDNPQMVKLHSFDTKIHKVDTLVSYKKDEWDEEE